MPPNPGRAPRTGAPGAAVLRLGTHNVRSMRAHLPSLVKGWLALRLDVVCLQETYVGFHAASHVQRQLNEACKAEDPTHTGFQCVWGYNQQPNAAQSAGVAVLVRRALLAAGHVRVLESEARADADGRLLSVSLEWGGHQLRLASVHLPNDGVGQQAAIARLPEHAPAGAHCVLAGDWNFVECAALDAATTAPLPQQQAAPPAARRLHEAVPGLRDALRCARPAQRVYTHYGAAGTSARRLDRVYVSAPLLPYVQGCWVADDTPSDHRPVVLRLGARVAAQRGPGVRRARVQQVWGLPATRLQLVATVQGWAAEAPADPPALLAWWPGFKQRCALLCERLARQAAAAQHTPPQQARDVAAEELRAAYAAVEHCAQPEQLPAALQRVLQARERWREQVAQRAQDDDWVRRRRWVHGGERPNAALTASMRPRAAREAQQVPALQSPATGALVQGGPQLAQLVVSYWARVSGQPQVDAEAEAQVLEAVRAQGLRVEAGLAEAVGAPEVTEAEVRSALKHAASGKAPGLDGLPVELYRRCIGVFAPLLARLFTAIGTTGALPLGWSDGLITTFYKAGPRSNPANYRPITLLNTDYRLLAKLLARRLRDVQGAVIGSEQTAFLPGRLIGDNVMLLQLLPHALASDSQAAAVFLDFRKAYDTISRPFLFKLLEEAGLGGGVLTWVRLLLSDTQSCATVNGYVSRRVPFQAGVRQGCPLAPQLYLFVAQAMLAWLKARGFGIRLGGRVITATQFADDAQVLLASVAEVPALLDAMATFEAASGQGLNPSKTQVLPMGLAARRDCWAAHHRPHVEAAMLQQAGAAPAAPRWPGSTPYYLPAHARPQLAPPDPPAGPRWQVKRRPQAAWEQVREQMRARARGWQADHRHAGLRAARVRLWVSRAVDEQLQHDPLTMPPGAAVGGLAVVGSATALGLTHDATGGSTADWPRLLATVGDRYARIASLPLSLFGRAFAASAYGLSKLLYAAEFVDLPPPAVLEELQALTAKLVDRKQAPGDSTRAFAGVAAGALQGHPKVGGCGVMPLEQHIRARHAKWAMRLVGGDDAVPWVWVARHVLVPQRLAACPAWRRLALPACNAATPARPEAVWPACVEARAVPPPLQRLVRGLQALPAWQDLGDAPLQPGAWCCNMPLWCNPWLVAEPGGPLPWRGLEARFGCVARLGTINTVAEAIAAHQAVHCGHAVYRAQLWPFWMGSHPVFADWDVADTLLTQLVAAIPAGIRQAVQQAQAQLSTQQLQQLPSAAQVLDQLVARLGWRLPGGKACQLQAMPVRGFTLLQWPETRAPLRARLAAFAQAVTATHPPGVSPVTVEQVERCLGRAWRVPWDNQRKEVWWRLVLDGLPTAARMGHRQDMPCACGEAVPGWQHHFWHCPVAKAVVNLLQGQLGQGAPALQPQHLWLAWVPAPGLHAGVWRVVALAALNALSKAQALLSRWQLQGRQAGRVVPAHVLTPLGRVQVASRVATATVWDLLQDFVALRAFPPTWVVEVPSAHPFVASLVGGGGERVLYVRRQP